jgi:hypothetical protein
MAIPPTNPIGTLTINNATATLAFAGTTTLTVSGVTTLSAGTIRIVDAPGVLSTDTFVQSGAGRYSRTGGSLNVTGAGTAFTVSGGSFT